MSSRRFKRKRCVYCNAAESITGDHVFARQFFLAERRDNLPKAPSCRHCNGRKSALEQYAMTLAPFGGINVTASESLEQQVGAHLQNNLRLMRELQSVVISKISDSKPTLMVPFDRTNILDLCTLIGRGLAWHHWKVYLTRENASQSVFLSPKGMEKFESEMQKDLGEKVEISLGHDTASFTGCQRMTIPEITM